MRLCHNMSSLMVYNAYSKNLTANRAASNKISTGLKINSAKDNPGKIGQLNQMEFQSRSLQAAQRNVQDGASMLQVADGALQEVNNILARMKELTISASDGAKSKGDLDSINEEILQLKSNIRDISDNTEFNGVKLLHQDATKNIMTGAMVGESDDINLYDVSLASLGLDGASFTITSDTDQNTKLISIVDSAIDKINGIRGEIGAKANVFTNLIDINYENDQIIQSASSRIGDADIAYEALEVARTNLLVNVGLGLVTQTNRLPLNCLNTIQGAKR